MRVKFDVTRRRRDLLERWLASVTPIQACVGLYASLFTEEEMEELDKALLNLRNELAPREP